MASEPASQTDLSRVQLLAEVDRLRRLLSRAADAAGRPLLEESLDRIRLRLLEVGDPAQLLSRLIELSLEELTGLGFSVTQVGLRLPGAREDLFLDYRCSPTYGSGAVQRRLDEFPWIAPVWQRGETAVVTGDQLDGASVPAGTLSLAEVPLPGRGGSLGLCSSEADGFPATRIEPLSSLARLFAEILQRLEEMEALNRREERLALALEAANMGRWEWDLETGSMLWSDNSEPLLGLPPGSFDRGLEGLLEFVHPDDREPMRQSLTRTLEQGSEHDVEFRLLRPDAGVGWFRSCGRVFFDRAGRPTSTTGVVMEVTQRRRAEEALRRAHEELEERVSERTAGLELANQSLQREISEHRQTEERLRISLNEKEVLLKEIHHRVKNNLQIVSSLLDMQASSIDDQRVLRFFADSSNRIRTMSLIHEKLYRSSDLVHLDLDDYVRTLGHYLLDSYGVGTGRIVLEIETEPLELEIDTIINCGLIINELVSNAFKYAFPGGQSGRVRIELRRWKNRSIGLCIEDDGVGLPPDLDYRRTETLGFRLVNSLVRHMQGTLSVNGEGGTRVEAVFASSAAGSAP